LQSSSGWLKRTSIIGEIKMTWNLYTTTADTTMRFSRSASWSWRRRFEANRLRWW
jgi:hypothetical protein